MFYGRRYDTTKSMLIGEVGEFGFIERVREASAAVVSEGFEGIGDDCAVLPLDGERVQLISTDMLLEGVHFLRDVISPYELGGKALAVNISDVAAMGGRPVSSFLSLALPGDVTAEWAEEFIRGYRDMSERYGVMLLGGDTTSSKYGVVVNVAITGEAPKSVVKRRGGAREGDVVVVNGMLGDSARGLNEILEARDREEAVPQSEFVAAHHNPVPQVEEGMWLASQGGVHAMMDISDGLGSDITHIMKASGIGAEIDTLTIPTRVSLREAVAGGEDYKLLATLDPAFAPEICEVYLGRFGAPLYIVGRITSAPVLTWKQGDKDITASMGETLRGFRHF